MKEQAIQKINKIGKISYVIAVICKILLIVGLVCGLIGAVVCFVIPESAMKITTTGSMRVEVDSGSIGGTISGEDIDGLQEAMEQGLVQVEYVQNGVITGNLELQSGGQKYNLTDVWVEDNIVNVEMTSNDTILTLRNVGVILIFAVITLVMTIITISFIEALCKAFRDCESPFEEKVIQKMQNLAISLIPWTIISALTESLQTGIMSGNMEWSLSVDLGVVLVVLIVLVLVYIFKYGAVLQQESDETL